MGKKKKRALHRASMGEGFFFDGGIQIVVQTGAIC